MSKVFEGWGGLSVLLLLLATGCVTSTGNALKATAMSRGAAIADEGLAGAKWFVCKGATVGSVKREYGRTVEDAEAYRKFCDGSAKGAANPVAPSGE